VHNNDRTMLFVHVHVDPEVQQTHVAAACVEEHVGVDLVLVGHDVEAIALLVGDQGIEGDVVRRFFRTQEVVGGHGRPGLEGETAGSPDGGEIRFERDVLGIVFFAAAALAGEGKPDHCNHKGADERFAHQFPPVHFSRCNHL
jgi:hypothetical protein